MALKGLSTLRTLRIFTTEIALELQGHAVNEQEQHWLVLAVRSRMVAYPGKIS